MKKILCPTDFSEAAQNATAYAAKLAQVTHCHLTLLNVQSVFDLTPAEVVRGKEITIEFVNERLEAESVQIGKSFKISCDTDVEPSARRLSKVIADKAKDYDLIVMGTDGPADLYQFFNGSNTYNAVVQSETPVLLVPNGYVFSEIKTITYAFDYLRERDLPMDKLIPLVTALKSELTILQVMEESPSEVADEDLKDLQTIIRNFYRNKVTFNFDTIRSEEIPQSINSYILRNQSDALALCSIHRNLLQRLFHKSVIKSLTAYCNYPVFVFHK
jgi:nucleotide-binding universal stress UspA family protein